MPADLKAMYDNARSLSDIFEVVKAAVRQTLGQGRGGLMLGLANLGNHPRGFLGAFFPVGTNIIVMNRVPLNRIKDTQPELYRPYAFHVLLHEYLHTLGHLDERDVRRRALEISIAAFGQAHMTARIAASTETFIPNLVYPDVAWQPESLSIELVKDFDRSSASYIG
ncbi:MAG: hypothetical protein HZB92_09185 [Euryarchaeota archaeon]|nr:hypothetical protein [Euryarchaeota archaeon]